MIIDERYQKGYYLGQQDEKRSIKNILYQISDEFNQLGKPESHTQVNTQNELLCEMRNITKQLNKQPRQKINIIDETIVVEQKQTQDFYNQLVVNNQLLSIKSQQDPKRIVKEKQYKSLKETLQKQESQTNIITNFHKQNIQQVLTGNLLQATSKEFHSQSNKRYFKSFKEFALDQVQQMKSQLQEIKKEQYSLTPNKTTKSGVKVNEFRKQLLVSKVKDKLMLRSFFIRLKYYWYYKKVVIQQLDQLRQSQEQIQQKIVFASLVKYQHQKKQKQDFLDALKLHLSFYRMKQIFVAMKTFSTQEKSKQDMLQRVILRMSFKRWLQVSNFQEKNQQMLYRLFKFVDTIEKVQRQLLLKVSLQRFVNQVKLKILTGKYILRQKSTLFKIWRQHKQIKKLRSVIREVAIFKKIQLIFRIWKKTSQSSKNLIKQRYFFKVWKGIPHAKIDQLRADNFRKSSLIVKNFQYWQRSFRQRKAFTQFSTILPFLQKKYFMNRWRKSAKIETRQTQLFRNMKQEQTKFRVFYLLKQNYTQSRQIKGYRLRKYFDGLKQEFKKNTQTIKIFRYFLISKLTFRKLLVNAKLSQVKHRFNNIFKNINLQRQSQKIRQIFQTLRDNTYKCSQKKRFDGKVSKIFMKKQKMQIFSFWVKYVRGKSREGQLKEKAQIISQNRAGEMQNLFFDCWKKAVAHNQIQILLEKKAEQIYNLKIKRRIFNQMKRQDRKVHFQEQYEENWKLQRQFKWNNL